MEYCEVQKIAKDTIEYIKKEISAGMRLTDVGGFAKKKCLRLERIHSGTGTLERLYSPETRRRFLAEITLHPTEKLLQMIITIDLSP